MLISTYQRIFILFCILRGIRIKFGIFAFILRSKKNPYERIIIFFLVIFLQEYNYCKQNIRNSNGNQKANAISKAHLINYQPIHYNGANRKFHEKYGSQRAMHQLFKQNIQTHHISLANTRTTMWKRLTKNRSGNLKHVSILFSERKKTSSDLFLFSFSIHTDIEFKQR